MPNLKGTARNCARLYEESQARIREISLETARKDAEISSFRKEIQVLKEAAARADRCLAQCRDILAGHMPLSRGGALWAEVEKLNSEPDVMSREELILSIRRLIEECSEKDVLLEINSAASTEMSVQYQQIRNENATLKKENEELLRQNRKLTEELRRTKNDLYGCKSEQSSGIEDAVLNESPTDPWKRRLIRKFPLLIRYDPPAEDRLQIPGKESSRKKGTGPEGLPTRTSYEIDVEELGRELEDRILAERRYP